MDSGGGDGLSGAGLARPGDSGKPGSIFKYIGILCAYVYWQELTAVGSAWRVTGGSWEGVFLWWCWTGGGSRRVSWGTAALLGSVYKASWLYESYLEK